MSSWKVEIRSGSGEVATVDLIDKIGPLNDWADKTPVPSTRPRGHSRINSKSSPRRFSRPGCSASSTLTT